MAQALASKEYNTFIQGLITEANPLTFPENASLDEDNFVLNRDGSRNRRLGIDYEQNFVLTDLLQKKADFEKKAVGITRWDNINDNASLSFAVIQVGLDLYFFDAFADDISAAPKNGGNKLTLTGTRNLRFQTTSISGRLIVVTGDKVVYELSYDEVTDTVSSEAHGLLVRDIWGVDDGLAIDERPTTLSQTHKYNLLNQGWAQDDPDSTKPYYETFNTGGSGGGGVGKYPSNADLVSAGKRPTADDQWAGVVAARQFLGSTPAPKGHFIIDVFDRGLSRAQEAGGNKLINNYSLSLWGAGISGAFSQLGPGPNPSFSGLPSDTTTGGIKVVASYSGRVFYTGSESKLNSGDSKSPLLGNHIFFSQIVDASDKVAKCYQDADPTSDEISDLVATDGGSVKIPEMSRALRLVPVGKSLVVVAENGVWEISGGEDGFDATNFQVIKLSDVGAINAESVIAAEGKVYYWSKGGIYAIDRDQVSLALSTTNLSENTIQSFFSDIPIKGRELSSGIYDSSTKQVRWLYNDESSYDGINERYQYNRELVLDLVLGAFYPSTISSNPTESPYLAGHLITPDFILVDNVENVVVGSDLVEASGVQVVVTDQVRTNSASKTKYLTIKPSTSGNYQFTLSLGRDDSFVDWKTDDSTGTDAPAFLETGYEIVQDTQRQKQGVYLTTHFERTETGFEDVSGDLEAKNPSSCLVQARWDFSDSSASGKFGTQFQAYRLKRNFLPANTLDTFDYGYKVITTKSKIRGRGRALRLKFDSEAGKDLFILGWAVLLTGNTNV